MANDNRLFEDLARVAQGAVGAVAGLREEMETRMRDHVDALLGRMNLVRREEFEAVKAMAAKARQANEALAARLDNLEKGGSTRAAASPSKAARKSARPTSRRGAKSR